MDWDLKVPASWDLAELEHEPGAAATPAAAGPSSGAHHMNAAANTGAGCRAPAGPECSVDLKLGGLGECELGRVAAADRRREQHAVGGKAPAPPASSSSPGLAAGAAKRPRPAGGSGAGQQCPSCAVDGCKADLSKYRDYHRRHKVCEPHSKTPVVVVAGREMRFCQQCSRFHLLAEFDETKRSCRKRLDGHNRRRRKPQPDPMTSASFITSQQGTRFSAFASQRPEPNWAGIIKTEEGPYYAHQIPLGSSNRQGQQQHLVGSTSSAYAKDGRRFPFLQEGEINFATGVVLEASSCQPLLKTVAAPPPESGSGSGKMFSDGGLMTRVLDSDCALSLLSAAPSNSSGIDVSRLVRPSEHVPMAQPLVSGGLQFGSSSSWFSSRPHQAAATGGTVSTSAGMESEQQQQLNTVLGASDTEMNYNGMFHVGGDGSSDGTSSSLPFSWQ